MTVRRALLVSCAIALGWPVAAHAQSAPRISLRPFLEITGERFAAAQSFDATFGGAVEALYGGGVQVTLRDRYFIDVSASRFSKTGDQVFVNNGQVFHLGLPMTATITPVELIGGYRFHPRRRRRPIPWLIPYAGIGVGWYGYVQASAFAEPSENLDTRKAGLIGIAGAEFRVHRWIGIAGDVVYTHVPGILGSDPSVSHQFGENDLGGVAGRFRIIVGR
jgi:hypothetical protein